MPNPSIQTEDQLKSDTLNKVLQSIYELLPSDDKSKCKSGEELHFDLKKDDTNYSNNATRVLYELFRLIKESKILQQTDWNQLYFHQKVNKSLLLFSEKRKMFRYVRYLDKHGKSWLPLVIDPITFKLAHILKVFFQDIKVFRNLPEEEQFPYKENIIDKRAIEYYKGQVVKELQVELHRLYNKFDLIKNINGQIIQADFERFEKIYSEYKQFSTTFGNSYYYKNSVISEFVILISKTLPLYYHAKAKVVIDKIKPKLSTVKTAFDTACSELMDKKSFLDTENLTHHCEQIRTFYEEMHKFSQGISYEEYLKLSGISVPEDDGVSRGLKYYVEDTYINPIKKQIKELIKNFKKNYLDPVVKHWNSDLDNFRKIEIEKMDNEKDLNDVLQKIKLQQDKIKEVANIFLDTTNPFGVKDLNAQLDQFRKDVQLILDQYTDCAIKARKRLAELETKDFARTKKDCTDLEIVIDIYETKLAEVKDSESQYEAKLRSLNENAAKKAKVLADAEQVNENIEEQIADLQSLRQVVMMEEFDKIFPLNSKYKNSLEDEYQRFEKIVGNNVLGRRSYISKEYWAIRGHDYLTCAEIIDKKIALLKIKLETEKSHLHALRIATKNEIATIHEQKSTLQSELDHKKMDTYHLLDESYRRLEKPEENLHVQVDYKKQLKEMEIKLALLNINRFKYAVNHYEDKIAAFYALQNKIIVGYSDDYHKALTEIRLVDKKENEELFNAYQQVLDAFHFMEGQEFNITTMDAEIDKLKKHEILDKQLEDEYGIIKQKYLEIEFNISDDVRTILFRYQDRLDHPLNSYSELSVAQGAIKELKRIEDLLDEKRNKLQIINIDAENVFYNEIRYKLASLNHVQRLYDFPLLGRYYTTVYKKFDDCLLYTANLANLAQLQVELYIERLENSFTQYPFENDTTLLDCICQKSPASIDGIFIIKLLDNLTKNANITQDSKRQQALWIIINMTKKLNSIADLQAVEKFSSNLKKLFRNKGFRGFFQKNKFYAEVVIHIKNRKKEIIQAPVFQTSTTADLIRLIPNHKTDDTLPSVAVTKPSAQSLTFFATIKDCFSTKTVDTTDKSVKLVSRKK